MSFPSSPIFAKWHPWHHQLITLARNGFFIGRIWSSTRTHDRRPDICWNLPVGRGNKKFGPIFLTKKEPQVIQPQSDLFIGMVSENVTFSKAKLRDLQLIWGSKKVTAAESPESGENITHTLKLTFLPLKIDAWSKHGSRFLLGPGEPSTCELLFVSGERESTKWFFLVGLALVVWIPEIPENESGIGSLMGTPLRIPNHRAPND